MAKPPSRASKSSNQFLTSRHRCYRSLNSPVLLRGATTAARRCADENVFGKGPGRGQKTFPIESVFKLAEFGERVRIDPNGDDGFSRHAAAQFAAQYTARRQRLLECFADVLGSHIDLEA